MKIELDSTEGVECALRIARELNAYHRSLVLELTGQTAGFAMGPEEYSGLHTLLEIESQLLKLALEKNMEERKLKAA